MGILQVLIAQDFWNSVRTYKYWLRDKNLNNRDLTLLVLITDLVLESGGGWGWASQITDH